MDWDKKCFLGGFIRCKSLLTQLAPLLSPHNIRNDSSNIQTNQIFRIRIGQTYKIIPIISKFVFLIFGVHTWQKRARK